MSFQIIRRNLKKKKKKQGASIEPQPFSPQINYEALASLLITHQNFRTSNHTTVRPRRSRLRRSSSSFVLTVAGLVFSLQENSKIFQLSALSPSTSGKVTKGRLMQQQKQLKTKCSRRRITHFA
ncbi:hypothetical protein PIB30_054267 [Stylosanthes scabra]|uniref:Uncharacterized protein n=1 Tax=Stylosanthes scabra TaxID=79078 RepID=A0ABU6TJN3_9FABA|nr:hypothetical protein [Stylosanthes scabra]